MGDADMQRREGLDIFLQPGQTRSSSAEVAGPGAPGLAEYADSAGYVRGYWAGADWLLCRDCKARPVERGTFPLAHGDTGRLAVVRTGTGEHWYGRAAALRCIGNAIVPQVAAAFIEASLSSIRDELS